MTSTASQPNTTPAPNTTAASTAPSYASAAGAAKKPASTPLVVGAANPSAVAGSSATAPQNVPSPSASNVNGRPSVTPAVPAVPTVAATPNVNGGPGDHARNGSVTIPPNGPTSYLANGGAVSNKPPGLQFGYAEASPAMPHSTPQLNATAPVNIPGAGRNPSPIPSPSPIPQNITSGGRPGNTENTFKIGSFTNDGDRIGGRPNSMSQMSFHARRDSAVSQHSDMGHHGPAPTRGGFGGGRGGRGGGYNHQYPNHSGFPPNTNQSYRGQGRGGMPPQQFNPRGGGYHNSPQPARGSPALTPVMPGQGTPNMGAAMPVPPAQGFTQQYPPPMSGYAQQGGFQQQSGYPPHVKPPICHDVFTPFKPHKKKGARWDSENRPSHHRQPDSSSNSWQEIGGRNRRMGKRRDSTTDHGPLRGRAPSLDQQLPFHNPPLLFLSDTGLDLSPGPNGGFERVERMLTASKQNFYPGGYDNRAAYMGMPQYPQQPFHPQSMYPPASPAPAGMPLPYGATQFAPPQGQPMSRNNSQMSERPASSTGQAQGPIVVSGAPGGHNSPAKAPTGSSTPGQSQFQKPKKSGVTIKNAAGEVVNFNVLKAPASPAPSIQQSRTPPVIASTPTPPPKAPTPASHTRTESISTAKPDEIKAAFLEQVKKSKEGDSTKTDDEAAADLKAKEEAQRKEEERAAAEKKAAEETKAAEEAASKAKAEAEAKAKAEAAAKAKAEEDAKAKAAAEATARAEQEAAAKAEQEAKAKAEEEAKVKAEEQKKADAAKAEEKPQETEDEYMERMIREMEEEDKRREEEQAKITAKKQVEKEAAKAKADAQRLADAAANDAKLREQEREMERLEEEKEKAREKERLEAEGGQSQSMSEVLTKKISDLNASQKSGEDSTKLTIISNKDTSLIGSAPSSAKSTGKPKPAALNLAPLKTNSVEPAPPTAAMQALKSARFLTIKDEVKYPSGIASPNPAVNAAVAKKGGSFKYDSAFLLQFQKVFTEQPSTEFSQQVKSLIGDSDGSRSASVRTPAGANGRQGSRTANGAFGAFAQPPGKPLPPNTTSEQRFAMSQGQIPRPAIGGPISSFRGGSFGGSQMSRTSSSNLAQSSSRSGSRSQRGGGGGGSKRGAGFDAQQEAKLSKTMPLTAGMDLKPIQTTATGWKPKSVGRAVQNAEAPGHMDPETVQRKVKSNLNKMTPENFDKISDQILQIAAQSKDEQDGRTLRQVIQLTFEKATDEAHWAAMYAKFCKRMLETMSPEVKDVTITDKNGNVVSGGALFRKYLLNRCQEDFEHGWAVEMPKPKEGESKETAMLSDEYYKAMAIKRRGLGLVQFIGELFKLGMLTERIMHECVRKLLDFQGEPDEAEIESLSKLLRTIGASLDSTEKGMMMMNAYFERISTLVETPDLPSRLQFMLMDIIDLRRDRWQTKDGLKGPKTREEIRAEAEAAAAQKAAENARSSYRGQAGGRSQGGRGDARNSLQFQQPTSNHVGMDDLRRLKGSASRTASGNVTLGPTSMFNSRSSSGRNTRLGPGGSLARGAEDSGASSRTGTPPTQASTNAFAALANMESENPASPPSVSASPALNHAKPAAPAGGEKKEAD
ncbi:hypothetical protein N8I77_007716 [Diaporthe amygdali]|uniref:MIF4G domain-containing protein n=1 Tax=Phomopsis amygdali TaxID=1214568 RepID=A0AAD9SCJ6_PHOAM|nr:hypothetical protein N8I77_007716 [Diaporthe amygdali]KAK2604817.1 hypothetical protein N8I77_007716 [Diaporthe amygdali]